jgi:hypothetical protein
MQVNSQRLRTRLYSIVAGLLQGQWRRADPESLSRYEIRTLRNSLAHDLPELILSENTLVVDIVHLKRIREIFRKIELFWIRIDMDIKGIVEDIPDETISGAESILDLIINTVFDYIKTTQETESV